MIPWKIIKQNSKIRILRVFSFSLSLFLSVYCICQSCFAKSNTIIFENDFYPLQWFHYNDWLVHFNKHFVSAACICKILSAQIDWLYNYRELKFHGMNINLLWCLEIWMKQISYWILTRISSASTNNLGFYVKYILWLWFGIRIYPLFLSNDFESMYFIPNTIPIWFCCFGLCFFRNDNNNRFVVLYSTESYIRLNVEHISSE